MYTTVTVGDILNFSLYSVIISLFRRNATYCTETIRRVNPESAQFSP